MGHTQHIYTN